MYIKPITPVNSNYILILLPLAEVMDGLSSTAQGWKYPVGRDQERSLSWWKVRKNPGCL